MITGDQELVKEINKSIVLNTIRTRLQISRARISAETGLNRSTVSALVNELIEENFVKEQGLGDSTGGKRPIILTINNNVGHIIGVDLGVNYILAILTDLSANVIAEKKVNIKIGESKDLIIEKLIKLIKELDKQAPKTIKGLLGIGIGVPGIVNYRQGIILRAPNLRWENVNLKSILEQEFKVNVYIDNEANAGAIGEKWFGTGMDLENFIYISAGIGVGAGIIIDNKLYRGAIGLAGEAGHNTINICGDKCDCGNVGCWESYGSEKALFSLIKQRMNSGVKDEYMTFENMDSLSVADVVDYAKRGSLLAQNSLKHIGKMIGIGVVNLVNSFNPEMVIIGNTLSLSKDIILPEIDKRVKEKCFVAKYHDVKIEMSKLNMHSCAIGAVSLVISQLFAYPKLDKV